ncbi:MAG: cell division protein FtsQ/DivIB [Gammaproteobacteria bacterium]
MARNRIQKRRARAKPRWRRIDWRAPLLSGALLAGLVASAYPALHLLDRPIRAIEIEAPFERVLADRIEAAAAGELPAGFLSVDLEGMRQRIAAIPWVDRVQIERRWPGALHITLTEQVAAARWGESGLLNTRGELFIPEARHVPAELPQLDGPQGMEIEVAKRYRDIHQRLLRHGMGVASLSVDERGAWSLEMTNGVEVHLGRHEIDDRVDRLVAVVTLLIASRPREISYVDMRYSNGFAVGWHRAMNADAERSRPKQAEPNV